MENFKEKFTPPNNDLCYYPLLYMALEATKGSVLELGMGHGSTPLLNEYCTKNKRPLYSFDYSEEWRDKFKDILNENHVSYLVEDWNEVYKYRDADVIFIDHSPGDERRKALEAYSTSKAIIIAHDTELAADHGYQMRERFKLFKYVIEINTNGAEATAMSNHYDVTKWNGEIFGNYKIGKIT